MYTHCLEVIARRIPTVQGYYIRFQTQSSVATANRMWFSGAAPHVTAYYRRLAQSVLTVGHTGDRNISGLLLPQ